MVRRTGAPRDTLAARLRTLAGAGILERRPVHRAPGPVRVPADEAGRDLYPVILTLMRWGDRHLADDEGHRWSSSTRAPTARWPRLYAKPAASLLRPARDGRPP